MLDRAVYETKTSSGKTIQQYNLQLNSNPDNSNLRSLIRKHGTHHVWATAERELKNSNENVSTEKMRDEIEELFDEFNKNKIEEDKTEGDTTRKDKSEANKKKS